MFTLYDYYRSSCAYRLRIALNVKDLTPERVHIDLRVGEHHNAEYRAITPLGSIPTLVDDGVVIPESLAAIEYLDEIHPHPPLLPADPAEKARVRSIALAVACDIHPVNNMRVLKYLTEVIGASEEKKNTWYSHWIAVGFTAIEKMLNSPETGTYCHGNDVTLADICLVPQVVNALRYKCDMAPFPTIRRIYEACEKLEAFSKAHPMNQPEAV